VLTTLPATVAYSPSRHPTPTPAQQGRRGTGRCAHPTSTAEAAGAHERIQLVDDRVNSSIGWPTGGGAKFTNESITEMGILRPFPLYIVVWGVL